MHSKLPKVEGSEAATLERPFLVVRVSFFFGTNRDKKKKFV